MLLALTLDAFSPTCTATSGADGTTFQIEYPLDGDLVAINAKTAEMEEFVSNADTLSAAQLTMLNPYQANLRAAWHALEAPPAQRQRNIVTL